MPTLFKTSSHYPVLIRAFEHTTGDICELGTGLFSTPLLHWLAADAGRHLVSYENDPKYVRLNHFAHAPWHELRKVRNWEDADIECAWGLVFVDHHPPERRVIEAKRVAPYATLCVVHDDEPRYRNVYHFERLQDCYKYYFNYTKFRPFTSIFSNFDSLEWCYD